MFKELFEGTVAADIAQATPSTPVQKRKRKGKDGECPCKSDPMGEECQKKRLSLEEASRNLTKFKHDLKNSIEYTGRYSVIDHKVGYNDAGMTVKDQNNNKFKITIDEM